MAHDEDEKVPSTPETLYTVNGALQKETAYEDKVDGRSIHSTHSTGSDRSTVAESSHDLEHGNDVLARTITPKQPLVKVPRSQRRGLFARFALTSEVTNPYDYKNSTKWFITFIVAISAAAAPMGSAIILC
jgi:hypothetical protein